MNPKDFAIGALILLLIVASGYSAVVTIQPAKTTTVTKTTTSTAIVYVNPLSGENYTVTKTMSITATSIPTVDGTCPTRYLNGVCQTITNQNLTYVYSPSSGYVILSNATLRDVTFAYDSVNLTQNIFFYLDSPRTTVSVMFPSYYRNWVFYNNGEVVNPVHFQNNTWSYQYDASFKQGSGELVLYLKQ